MSGEVTISVDLLEEFLEEDSDLRDALMGNLPKDARSMDVCKEWLRQPEFRKEMEEMLLEFAREQREKLSDFDLVFETIEKKPSEITAVIDELYATEQKLRKLLNNPNFESESIPPNFEVRTIPDEDFI